MNQCKIERKALVLFLHDDNTLPSKHTLALEREKERTSFFPREIGDINAFCHRRTPQAVQNGFGLKSRSCQW